MSWPSLDRRPKVEMHEPLENVIKHETESGKILRRKRYTVTKFKFTLTYDLLDTTDANAIIALWNSNNLHSSFSWTDKNSVERTVFFDEAVQWSERIPGWFQFESFVFAEA